MDDFTPTAPPPSSPHVASLTSSHFSIRPDRAMHTLHAGLFKNLTALSYFKATSGGGLFGFSSALALLKGWIPRHSNTSGALSLLSSSIVYFFC